MKNAPNSGSHPTSGQPKNSANPRTPTANTPLVNAAFRYETLNRHRFHMPGHCGTSLVETVTGPLPGIGAETYRYDFTELDGLDVLSEPTDSIQAAQGLCAEAFGAAHSFFLVNGASAGLVAAMLSCLKPGEKVLVPRNVHRSVLSGLILTGARPVWFLPEWIDGWGLWGAVTPETVEALIREHPEARALILASPTYEGIGSDIEALSALCRRHGLLLIVDEAHGSLLPFLNDSLLPFIDDSLPPSESLASFLNDGLGSLPISALRTDCDVVVHSLHKTAGSLTQTAVAHLPQGSRIAPEAFQQALNMVQTTSPSYLLLTSLDASRAFLASETGQARIQETLARVQSLRNRLKSDLTRFELFEPTPGLDPAEFRHPRFWNPMKLYLRLPGVRADVWAEWVECEQTGAPHIAYEAASPYGALYLAGLGLEPTDYEALYEALITADRDYQTPKHPPKNVASPDAFKPLPAPQPKLLPRDAFFRSGEHLAKAAAVGRIAKETVVHCPPGVPVVIPGEIIQPEHLPWLPDTVEVVKMEGFSD